LQDIQLDPKGLHQKSGERESFSESEGEAPEEGVPKLNWRKKEFKMGGRGGIKEHSAGGGFALFQVAT